MKTMCPPRYHHNVATHALGHIMCGSIATSKIKICSVVNIICNCSFPHIHVIASGLNMIFFEPHRLSGRNDVPSDKVNFTPDITQNFSLKKMRTSRFYVALKTICSSCTLINIKFR